MEKVKIGDFAAVKSLGDGDVIPIVQTADGKTKNCKATVKQLSDALKIAVLSSHHFGVRWDLKNAVLERAFDASAIDISISQMAHRGSVSESYTNPFDYIYPWSEIRLCNIDLEKYAGLTSESSLRECIKAWEGDPDFSYDDEGGVWRYCPSFYGISFMDGDYRYFDVADKYTYGYVFYPESLKGRYFGNVKTVTVGGDKKECLIPSPVPTSDKTGAEVHSAARAYGATLESIYSLDADILLSIVEFATMDMQSAIGKGIVGQNAAFSDAYDEAIGSKSGFIGTDGFCNAYYRGTVMYGGKSSYILGAYQYGEDNSVCVARDNKWADMADNITESDSRYLYKFSGTRGYVGTLYLPYGIGMCVPPFCTSVVSSLGESPVKDYYNPPLSTYNKVLAYGGGIGSGSGAGIFTTNWSQTASSKLIGKPRLKHPVYG